MRSAKTLPRKERALHWDQLLAGLLLLLLLLVWPVKTARRPERAQFDSEPPVLVYEPAVSPLAAAQSGSASIQCEPITVGLCSQLAYQSTRMPNFFKDTNQIEALDRALQFQELVVSKCSAHVHAYVCELLTPVCLEDSHEAMKRFEIYPCRSFCRRVKRDCEAEISRLSQRLYISQTGLSPAASILPGFACDQLPFESNGGNGTLRGPCHETPEPGPSAQQQSEQQQQLQQPASKSNYRPYQPLLDSVPFITDTSRLDSSMIKPDLEQSASTRSSKPDSNKPSQQQQQQGFLSQLGQLAQTLLWTLSRYSNILSIATVLCLLAALNSKRLRRLKRYLRFSPSRSAKSSSGSSGSNGSRPAHGYPPISSQGRHHSLSPSSSSRSLMLIAGPNGKQPVTHQLLLAAEEPGDPSKKLLHGLSHQKTLINVNGTLERPHNNNSNSNSNAGRYLIMQPAGKQRGPFVQASDKQQLFNTLDSQSSHSNQYDYIQVNSDHLNTCTSEWNLNQSQQQYLGQQQPSQFSAQRTPRDRDKQQQQQQLYSNILLSSPSHQVLLLNSRQQPLSSPSARNQNASQQVRRKFASAALSPYAVPEYQPTMEAHQQRSFQRRTKRSLTSGSQRHRSSRPGYASSASSGSSCSSSALSPPSSQPAAGLRR